MTRLLSLAHSMLILGALCDQKTFTTFTGWVFLAVPDGSLSHRSNFRICVCSGAATFSMRKAVKWVKNLTAFSVNICTCQFHTASSVKNRFVTKTLEKAVAVTPVS